VSRSLELFKNRSIFSAQDFPGKRGCAAQPSHPHAGQTAKGVVHVVSSEGVVTSQGCVMGENSLLGSPSTNPRHKPGQVGGFDLIEPY
jgi:hypothetical protein